MKNFIFLDYEISDLLNQEKVRAVLRPSNVAVDLDESYYVGESWAQTHNGGHIFHLNKEMVEVKEGESLLWRDPLFMPEELARFKIKIGGVFMKRISLINSEELKALNFSSGEQMKIAYSIYNDDFDLNPVIKIIYFELL